MSAAETSDDPATISWPTPPARIRHRWILERVIALAIALLLLRSSFAHLGNPYYFLSTVYSYQLGGIETGRWVGIVLPFLQIAVGVALLFRWWIREAYFLAFTLFLGFVLVQAITIHRGLDISCGCFGASDSLKLGWKSLAVSGGAAAAAMIGWFCARTNTQQRARQ